MFYPFRAVISHVAASAKLWARDPAGGPRCCTLCWPPPPDGGEFAALVDTGDAFDPCSAAATGVELSRLIWVRCGGRVEPAMRAADLLIQAGGFGVVAIDLAEAAPRQLQRIPATAWFRFRRAVESSPTILAVLADRPLAKSCATLAVKLPPRRAEFTGRAPFLLLRDAG